LTEISATGKTAIVCCTCVAANHVPLPAWLASITHEPAAVNVTLPPDSVQPVLLESSVIVTLSPDVAVAVGV
jgi:hypothetical protein